MYRSVMEDCALSKPELLLQLEREELSTPLESEPEAADMSPEVAVEPARQNCTSNDMLLETEAMERGCREPEESGNVAERSGSLVEDSKNLVGESRSPLEICENLAEESKNLVEENGSPVEINGNLAEESKILVKENRSPAEENRSLAKESRSPAEESGNLMEESRSPVVPENCSTRECLANPSAVSWGPASLSSCSSPTFITALALTAPVPLEGAAVLVDLSQLTPSPPCPLSVFCQEAEGQNSSPLAAGDAEARIPTEVLQEEVVAEKLLMPKTPSEGPEEDKCPEEQAGKDSGNTGQDLVANIPEEPGKEVTPDVCRPTEQADPSPGELEKGSCAGRPTALQRNSAKEFYSCPICRKTFLLKINLLIHERGHTNWVPYVCVHCDRKFMSKKKIRRHLRAWAANGTCQPSEPSQVPCPASHPQTWAANGTCQASEPEKCPSRTPCPTSQPQTWPPNGSCQPLDTKACPIQGIPCPTSQPQNWPPNGSCQPLDAKACPSQGPCQTSQCPTSQAQTWAANSSCQPSKPEECPSQTQCSSSQPQVPSRDCGTVWQEPSPASCSLSPGKMMYTCNECLETFSNQIFLTVHQRRHSGHHLILCPCCNRSFTWVSDFVRQHWMYMGVRPHQCGICQKTFKRFSHLKVHQRIHRRQERPFTCANPVPVVAAPAAGDGVGSQDVTPQGWGAAVGP
ncbi:zinc finger and SCAN domain-containing protein 20-like [Cinclus cinclus]|uniref:zinc finger and SCAN domain-containing protein 20-like n=1 Tax=Cinclus cinclus TaxID=127875 RepID=UPI002E0E322D